MTGDPKVTYTATTLTPEQARQGYDNTATEWPKNQTHVHGTIDGLGIGKSVTTKDKAQST